MGNCCCSDAPFVFDVEGDMRRVDIGKSHSFNSAHLPSASWHVGTLATPMDVC